MRRKITAKDLLREISLRNRIAQFQDINLRELGTAAIPRVGIFWVGDTGTMYSESTSLREAVDYGNFRTHDGSHHDAWHRAVRHNPSWQGYEYEEVPRGRVVYRRHPKHPAFIVYMPDELRKHIGKILAEFKLPVGYTRFDCSDEHYRMLGRSSE